jgi:DNA-binding IclR family transcriptional regulator
MTVSQEKVDHVTTCLAKGDSIRRIARVCGVNRSVVLRIRTSLQSQRYVRCAGCGGLQLLPCRVCQSRIT